MSNPFQTLAYESALQSLGNDFFDAVKPASFPQHILRFRNDDLLPILGLKPDQVHDQHFVEFFGQFQGHQPCLALHYHGYQFGQYNPYLGDGRGFLYGQVRGVDGQLYDFGTKGSGTTPHSQTRDGRLSLKGGIREVIAAEVLHHIGAPTSRCLSLIETGEQLDREDEDSPARSAVMVRQSRSHIRFGTFERLEYYDRPDLIKQLLDHVITYYYPDLWQQANPYHSFYAKLVQRVADLVAHWMASGFCHGVLNTDNMSIVGEGFDYGPYAFIETYNPYFTAASFDRVGRYSYRNQPKACCWNLEKLQRPLSTVIPIADMEVILESFSDLYTATYHQILLNKLGIETLSPARVHDLVGTTLEFLLTTRIQYHHFFNTLRQRYSRDWCYDSAHLIQDLSHLVTGEHQKVLTLWCKHYHWVLQKQPPSVLDQMEQKLQNHNSTMIPTTSEIEEIWQAIAQSNNWQPFVSMIRNLRSPVRTALT